MPDISKYVPLLVVICVGIVFQVLLIPLDCITKPYKAAARVYRGLFKNGSIHGELFMRRE